MGKGMHLKWATFGAFWALSFYITDARFTHKKQRFGLEISGQIHKVGVLSSRTTETANEQSRRRH